MKLNPVGGNTFQLSTRHAQLCFNTWLDSHSFYPLICCKSIYLHCPAAAHGLNIVYSSVSSYPGMTRSSLHQATPTEHFESRTIYCAPHHCRRAVKHGNCRSSAGTKPSPTGKRCYRLQQWFAEEAAWSTAAVGTWKQLAAGQGNRMSTCRGPAGIGSLFPQKPVSPDSLCSQIWLGPLQLEAVK